MKRKNHLTLLMILALMVLSYSCRGETPDSYEFNAYIPDKLEGPYERNVQLGVFSEGEMIGMTSGVIWDDSHILTVEHLMPEGKNPEEVEIFVIFPGMSKGPEDKIPVTVEKSLPLMGEYGDLMLLEMEAPDYIREKNFQPPKVADHVTLTETVYIIGAPVVHLNLLNSIIETKIANALFGGGVIVLNFQAISGLSGAAVWNERGELVGILSRRAPDMTIREYVLSFIVGPATIRDFTMNAEE